MTLFLSHSYPGNVAREPEGMPLAYFPLRSPEASGLHIVVPSPISLYRGRYSSSTRSRCSMLYWGCSICGGVRPYSLANPIVHSTNSLLDRRVRVRSMTEEEIQIIQLQSFEGFAAGLEYVFSRQAFVVWSVAAPEDFAGDNYVLPRPSQFLENIPHDNFGFPVSVGLCAVEEIDTLIICDRHALDGDFFADLSTVGHPGTE